MASWSSARTTLYLRGRCCWTWRRTTTPRARQPPSTTRQEDNAPSAPLPLKLSVLSPLCADTLWHSIHLDGLKELSLCVQGFNRELTVVGNRLSGAVCGVSLYRTRSSLVEDNRIDAPSGGALGEMTATRLLESCAARWRYSQPDLTCQTRCSDVRR